MRLEGKIAVITGAASGVGRAAAELFAQEGARVACVDINDTGGKEVAERIRQDGGEALFIQADVANSEQVRQMARKCGESYKSIDILFNNAGSVVWEGFEATTEETWHQMMGVNLTSIFLCSKHLLPLMKSGRAGSIINHASIDAILGNPHVAAYSAAKGGIIPLTHVMAYDLARYNIRVNCLSSGGIATAISNRRVGLLSKLEAFTPLARRGTPDEVARVALFLASEESSYVNGANLVIDGGRTGITQGTY